MARTFARFNPEQRAAYLEKLPDSKGRLERLNAVIKQLKDEGRFVTEYWSKQFSS